MLRTIWSALTGGSNPTPVDSGPDVIDDEPNPVLQLCQLLDTQPAPLKGPALEKKDCDEFFTKHIAPLSPAELRRYLTTPDNALLRVLAIMQFRDHLSLDVCWHAGCQLLFHSFYDFCFDQQATRDKRQFCMLLLRHAEPLCSAARSMCSSFQEGVVKMSSLQVYLLNDITSILWVFVWLLMETRKDEPIRPMASLLLPMYRLFTAVAFFLGEDKYYATPTLLKPKPAEPLPRACNLSAILIERIVASVPIECVDDITAASLAFHAFRVPSLLSVESGRPLNRFPSDKVIRRCITSACGTRIIFNKEYFEAALFDLRPGQAIVRASLMLVRKLPEKRLRRYVDADAMHIALAMRRCTRKFEWSIPKPERVCSAEGCGKLGESFPVCDACGVPEYCSAECQRNDWLKHKEMCVCWRQKLETKSLDTVETEGDCTCTDT